MKKNYNPTTRKFLTPKGNFVVSIIVDDIRDTFNILEHKVDIRKTKKDAMKDYENRFGHYICLINEEQLEGPKMTHS